MSELFDVQSVKGDISKRVVGTALENDQITEEEEAENEDYGENKSNIGKEEDL